MSGLNCISTQNQVRILPFYRQQDNNTRHSTGIILNQSITNPINSSTEKCSLSFQTRQMLRELDKTPATYSNPYTNYPANKKIFPEPSDSSDNDENNTIDNSSDYNYKEVETRIRQAKNSISAGQAVISAKRKVMEVKRKIASSNGDPEELQLALTHAKRMEIVAKRKKHHLELEELIKTTGERDDHLSEQEKQNNSPEYSMTDPIKEDIEKKEDEIFKERQDILSDEPVSELNRMILEFGEEELKELEKSMEFLEDMEIVDPHMSKEDFEDLKRKHRSEEQKAMLKADMDYLKELIKHQTESLSAPATSGILSSPVPATAGFTGFNEIEAPGVTGSVSVDTVV